MMALTTEDFSALRVLTDEISEGVPEQLAVFETLRAAYLRYGDDVRVEQRWGGMPRPDFFSSTFQALLENLKFAGVSSSDEAGELLMSQRGHIKATLKRLGVQVRNVEDLASDAILKLWRGQCVENYNPLVSSWGHYLHHVLKNMVCTDWAKRSRNAVDQGLQIDQLGREGEESRAEVYESEQGFTAHQRAVLAEALGDFEDYLAEQEPFRPGVIRPHRECCTLVSPGGKDYAVEGEEEAYIVQRGFGKNHRVELKDGRRLLMPALSVEDIRPNPEFNAGGAGVRVERTFLALYRLVYDRGAQVEEIAAEFKIGNSTAHHWVRQLEEHFRNWWKSSAVVPASSQKLAESSKACPGCGETHYGEPEEEGACAVRAMADGRAHWKRDASGDPTIARWCVGCGEWALDEVDWRSQLPMPWGAVRGNHEMVERSGRYRTRYTAPRCAI